MDKLTVTKEFEDTFADYMQNLKNLAVNFGKENPSLGACLTSSSKDPETNLLLSSFAHQISENDLKVENLINSFHKKFLLNNYPELTSQTPQYCMIKIDPDASCFDETSPKFITTDDSFFQQTQYGPLLKFRSMTNKQISFHKITNVSYYEHENKNSEKFLYYDKLTPTYTEPFSYFKISIDLQEQDENKFNIYVHSALENSLQILDEIIMGKSRFFIVLKDKTTQEEKTLLIDKKHIHIPFNFEHYLGKPMDEVYGLFDFSNFIYKYFFFNIDLTHCSFGEGTIDILIETKQTRISKIFKPDLFQLNVFPVINVYYENKQAYKVKKDKTVITIKNSENSQQNFLGIHSVELFDKDALTQEKIFSLQEAQAKILEKPQIFAYNEKGWDAKNSYFSLDIIKLSPDFVIPKNLYVLPKCLYTNGIYIDLFSSKEKVDSDLNFIKNCSVVFVAPAFRSPDSIVMKVSENISFLNHIKNLNILSNINWVFVLIKTLEIACFNDINKKYIKDALGKCVCEISLVEDEYKSMSLNYNIKSLKSSQNSFGAYFFLEFLKQYLFIFKDINLNIDFGSLL